METKTISGKEIALIKSGVKKIGHGVSEVIRGTLKVVSSLLNYAAVFVSFGKDKKAVSSSGFSNVLKQPEFQRINIARQIVETLEQEELMAQVLEEYSRTNPISIKIGHENRHKEMRDLSIVVATNDIRGIYPGAIGIIGPTRMDYERVTSVLRYVSEEIEELINRERINV